MTLTTRVLALPKLGAALFALIASAGAASAATLTYEYGSKTTFMVTEIDYANTLAKFDTSLGTLTGVTLTLYEAIESDLGITNTASNAQDVDVEFGSRFRWTSGDTAINTRITTRSVPNAPGTTVDLISENQSFTLAPGESTQLPTFYHALEHVIDMSPILESFHAEGGGTFSLRTTSQNRMTTSGGGGNLVFDHKTTAAVWAQVTYTYVPIPEPSVMVFAGLFGVAGLCRRSRRA